jgi:glutamine amidotransferase
MCRHLAYLGPPVSLATLVAAPEYGLVRQSWQPREQAYGLVNADGFGVGWYADDDPVPARYRRSVPIWTDASFADVSRVTRTRAAMAAVRSATIGTSADESAAAPYTEGTWLFSHNGRMDGWPDAVSPLVARLAPHRLLTLEARVDSALVWALVLDRLVRGTSLGGALAAVVADVRAVTTGRLNLLLTDGQRIAATAVGDTLYWARRHGGLVVASEPSDDDQGWVRVPDNSLLTATSADVEISALQRPTMLVHSKETSRP